MSITFDGFEKLAAELDKQGKELKPAVTEALEETQKYIQQQVESASEVYSSGGRKGYAEGNLVNSIITDPKIEWEGNTAKVGVGFSSQKDKKGFIHSLFVMYGVPAHGKFNRGYQKDTKVYNAIRGIRTKNEIKKIQQEVMKKYLDS